MVHFESPVQIWIVRYNLPKTKIKLNFFFVSMKHICLKGYVYQNYTKTCGVCSVLLKLHLIFVICYVNQNWLSSTIFSKIYSISWLDIILLFLKKILKKHKCPMNWGANDHSKQRKCLWKNANVQSRFEE